MADLTRTEVKKKAFAHIERCDNLFDGKHEDGTPSEIGPDKEFAYAQVRLLAFELLEELVPLLPE